MLLEFRQRLAAGATWIQGDCISFGQSIAFMPVIAMLKRHFGVVDGDSEAAAIEKIARAVAALGDAAPQIEPYLRYLMAVDPGDPGIAALDPAQRRAKVTVAIQHLFAAASRRRPLVLVVEDMHWIDSASEELLKSLVEALPGMRVLLVLTYRPVYPQPFGERMYYWRIALQPVDEDDAVSIVRATLGVADLPRDLAVRIAGKAEGNPFFLEEIGRALIETGSVRTEGGGLVLAQSAATIAVPETVQDVIAARLDRLQEPQKRTVQTASVIGREFALGLLRRVSDLRERLEQSLGELKRIELIYEKAGLGELEYVFRHALTQDVAYASLLQAERRRLHGLIGAAIEELYAGRLEERSEELAHHFTRGETWDKVVIYAREAAERAAGLCVDDRAVEYYRAALAALTHLPETAETARTGIDLRLAMRAPLWRGGHPEALATLLQEAEALATRHGDHEHLDTIYAFFVQYHWAKGEQDAALEYGGRCLARAEARGDLGLQVTGLYYMAHAYTALGRHRDAVGQADAICRLLAGRETERFGMSGLPYAGACVDMALSLLELGDEAGARAALDRGRRAADAANHLYSQMVIAQAAGHLLAHTGAVADAITLLEETVATCRAKNFAGQLINALHHLGDAYVRAGRPAEAMIATRESIDIQERAGVSVRRAAKLVVLVDAATALGDHDAAEAALRAA
ncbi:MAG: ATP-binding protein, partial [Candidatus Rokuibacteriota bacterium]